jgi:hypothetical protein
MKYTFGEGSKIEIAVKEEAAARGFDIDGG